MTDLQTGGCPHCAAQGYIEIAMTSDTVTCRECKGTRERQAFCDATGELRYTYGAYCEPVRQEVRRERSRRW